MTDDNDYRRGRHCVFALHAHLVFVTKYRRKVFTANVLNDMRDVFAAVSRKTSQRSWSRWMAKTIMCICW